MKLGGKDKDKRKEKKNHCLEVNREPIKDFLQGHQRDGFVGWKAHLSSLHRRRTRVETHGEVVVSSIRVKKGWTEVMAEGCWRGGLADVSAIVLMCPITPFTYPRDQKEKPSWGMGLSATDSECMDSQLSPECQCNHPWGTVWDPHCHGRREA